MPEILSEWLALSVYTLFMGFCFCDGFGLHIIRKAVWFTIFLAVCFYTFSTQGHFDMAFILAVASAVGLIVCAWEKRLKALKGK